MLQALFTANKNIKVFVGYGSQEGNAEAIANILYYKIKIINKKICPLNEVKDIKQLEEYDYVILNTSSAFLANSSVRSEIDLKSHHSSEVPTPCAKLSIF